MATIGTFKKSANEYVGEIVTLSVQLDDPRFTAPIYANLFDDTVIEGEDSYSLIWSRSRRQNGD